MELKTQLEKIENITHLIKETLEIEYLKSNENSRLLFYYNKCLSLMNNSSVFKRHFEISSALVRGALAEVLCEEICNTWLETKGIFGRVVSNSLIERFPNNPDNDYTTQLDITVITTKGVLVLECKSLFGKLTTDGEAIYSPNLEEPVYAWKQNKGHIDALRENIIKLYKIRNIDFKNIVFMFSIGKLVEWQQPENKDEYFIVPKGSLAELNEIYKQMDDNNLSEEEVDTIYSFLKSKIPTIDDMEEHINSLARML